jgi:N-lysine methyltransferase SETD6
MVATQDIKAGDQIWNTYGDLPNSHLLRRYGYVDIIPCSRDDHLFPFENPADEVEIRADLVMDICVPAAQGDERVSKIDTWISLGGEE